MRRVPLLAAVLLASLVGASAVPAKDAGTWQGWKPYQNHYLNAYKDCWAKLGSECGRNIVDDGYRQSSGKVRDPSPAEVKSATARIGTALSPPKPVAEEPTAPSTQPTTSVEGSAPVSSAPPEAIAQCESGGSPTAVSPDGTYRGKWQFDYGTWQSVGGSGDPAAASEQEQDYRAGLLYQRSGSAPWPVCGQ